MTGTMMFSEPHSIEPITPPGTITGPVQTPPETAREDTKQSGESQEEASKQQLCWNTAMRKYMGIPDGYQKVAVLIIKWHEGLDDLRCEKEVG